jgi:hypothetical protein
MLCSFVTASLMVVAASRVTCAPRASYPAFLLHRDSHFEVAGGDGGTSANI